MTARNGSVRTSSIAAKTIRSTTAVDQGNGFSTSVAASTSDSACAMSSPVGWARWKARGSSRYRSTMRVLSVRCILKPVIPAKYRRTAIPAALTKPTPMMAAAAHAMVAQLTPCSNAGRSTWSVSLPRTTVVPIVAAAYTAAPVTAMANGSGCVAMYERRMRKPRTKTLDRSLISRPLPR